MKKLLWCLLPFLLAAKSPVYLEELATDRLQALDFSQKPTVITFIQPACGPCKRQLAQLKCVFESAADRVQVLAVQASGDSVELARSLKALRLPFPVLKGTPAFLHKYEADQNGTPMSVVLAKGGDFQERVLGPKPCQFWLDRTQGEKI